MNTSEISEYIQAHYLDQSDAEIGAALGLSSNAVRHRRRNMGLRRDENPITEIPAGPAPSWKLGAIRDLLERSNIPVEEIDRVEKVRVSSYQMLTKNEDGEADIHDLQAASLVLKPIWENGPQWPVIQPAPPVQVTPLKVTAKPLADGWKRAVLLPDPQIGFRRILNSPNQSELNPFHDEQAMNVALQIVNAVQPDLIVNMGDFIDFPEFSAKFLKEAGFQLTTQSAIDRAGLFLAEQRANAPEAKIVLMEGNHDKRLPLYIQTNALAAYGLRRANKPDSWPALSVPVLLDLDELGVEYYDGYPAREYWINDNFKCIHGYVSKNEGHGATAKQLIEHARETVAQGHNHRLEQTFKTVYDHGEIKIYAALTVGSLCRIDGAVPAATRSAPDHTGRPVPSWQNWQQGLCVVEYQEGNGAFHAELVPILFGQARYRGEMYSA